MEIKLIQGDASSTFKFQRRTFDGSPIKTKCQKMWITFKSNTNDSTPAFQKTLENGISFNEEDFYYKFQIDEEDSDSLPIGEYGFDIAIINESGDKKTILNDGVLRIVDHYTKKENEV